MRLVQGQVGTVVADHATRSDGRDRRSGSGGGQARVRSHDGDEKDRHRRDRSGSARLTVPTPADWSCRWSMVPAKAQLGVNFIDTADSYGPEVIESLIAQPPSGLHRKTSTI